MQGIKKKMRKKFKRYGISQFSASFQVDEAELKSISAKSVEVLNNKLFPEKDSRNASRSDKWVGSEARGFSAANGS